MTRRLIVATVLVGTVAGAAGTALANQPVRSKPHQVCVVLYQEDNSTKDFCVDYGIGPV
jgi:hypothetical protein